MLAGANKPELHDKAQSANQITSEIFSRPFTMDELKDLMTSVMGKLHQMGLHLTPKLDNHEQPGSGKARIDHSGDSYGH